MNRQAMDIAPAAHEDAAAKRGAADAVSAHVLDRAIRWAVYGMLVFAPAALGAVDGWSESVLVLLAGLIAVGLAVRALRATHERATHERATHERASHERGGDWTWAYVPLGLFALLVAFQLLPLPPGLLKIISPHTWELKTRLLADVPNSRSARWMTLSLYPQATRATLRVLLIAAVVFAAVAQVFRRSSHVKRLLCVMALVGAASALLALAQDVSGATAVYWVMRRPVGVRDYLATAGPLINYNHYAQLANLSLGAALALLLARLTEARLANKAAWLDSATLSPRVRGELRRSMWLAAVIAIIALSVFLSRSRGGMIALGVATVVTAVACAFSRSLAGRGWVPTALALGVLSVLLALGAMEGSLERLLTLRQRPAVAAKARVEVARDVGQLLVPRFPLLGTGLGTHEMVYPMVSRQTFYGLAGHVENEYVQVLEETGAVGWTLVAGFAIAIGAAWVHAARRVSHRPARAAVFGLAFGLVAILVHSASDFGQRIPAVACMTMACGGLIVSLSRTVGSEARSLHPAATPGVSCSERPDPPVRRATLVPWLGAALAILVFGWALVGAVRCAAAEYHWDKALAIESDLSADHWQGSDAAFAELIVQASAASAWEPLDVQYRHWLNVYRWYSVARVDPQAGRVLVDDAAREYARRIVGELHATRALCPTFGLPLCTAGQIELLFLGDAQSGERHIEQGYELARAHPQCCLIAGTLDARRGRWDESREKLSRALTLGAAFDDVLDVYLRQTDRADLALEMAGDDASRLMRVAEVLRASGRHNDVAATARTRAAEVIRKQADDPAAPAYVLASAAQLVADQRDFEAAAGYYRRALLSDYGRADWHLGLAQALVHVGRGDEAIREARLCLRLRPNAPEARQIIDEVGTQSQASYKEPAAAATTPPVH